MFYWLDPAWKAWGRLSQRLPHAVLVQAPEGCGAFEFAQMVASSLLCENPGAERKACGACLACRWFGQGSHPDFRLIVPESMTENPQSEGEESPRKEKRSEQVRIEQVRELADLLSVGTHRGGHRVILIYPADAMNPNTQNALLKSLEEPPPSTVFLLVTSQTDRLLPTVRSRCMRFSLPVPDPERVLRWLGEEGVEHPGAALAGAGGAPLAALKAAGSDTERRRFFDGLKGPRMDPIRLAESIQRIPVGDAVDWLQRWSHDLLLTKFSGAARYYPDRSPALAEISSRCRAEDICAFLRYLAQARSLARHPLNPKLFVEDLLLRYRRLTEGAEA
jgi:DNA polymerase-3 subunit delta'